VPVLGTVGIPRSAIPDSFIAYTTPVKYTFSFYSNAIIPKDGKIVVNFPSDITIANSALAANTCSNVLGFQVSILGCVLSNTPGKITIANGFPNANFDPNQLSFSINYLLNPRTTKQTGSFGI
jgi:hypothetical protein